VTEILEYIYGPRAVIAEEFSSIPGVKRLLIFGSWAARHSGVPGLVPHDAPARGDGIHRKRDLARISWWQVAPRGVWVWRDSLFR